MNTISITDHPEQATVSLRLGVIHLSIGDDVELCLSPENALHLKDAMDEAVRLLDRAVWSGLPAPSVEVFCGHCGWEGTYGETHPDCHGYCPKCCCAIWMDSPAHRELARAEVERRASQLLNHIQPR